MNYTTKLLFYKLLLSPTDSLLAFMLQACSYFRLHQVSYVSILLSSLWLFIADFWTLFYQVSGNILSFFAKLFSHPPSFMLIL